MSEASRTATINGQEYQPAALDWSLGWRYELVRDVRGQECAIHVFLTPEEARHLNFRSRMPNEQSIPGHLLNKWSYQLL